MLEVADEGVLVIVVHMGDDALLRCGVGCVRGFVRHAGFARTVVTGGFERCMRLE